MTLNDDGAEVLCMACGAKFTQDRATLANAFREDVPCARCGHVGQLEYHQLCGWQILEAAAAADGD